MQEGLKWLSSYKCIPHFLLAAGSLYLFSTASYAADTLAKICDPKSITVAYQEGSVPFSFLDEKKKPAGYALGLCLKFVDAIRKELKLPQLKVNYFPVDTANRIPAIVKGKADIFRFQRKEESKIARHPASCGVGLAFPSATDGSAGLGCALPSVGSPLGGC